MGRLRRPKRREPDLPPWRNTECDKCATPVRVVYTNTVDLPTIEVGMKPAPLNDKRATIAASAVNGRLEGRILTRTTAPQSHENVWIPHVAVCPEIQRDTQLDLLEES